MLPCQRLPVYVKISTLLEVLNLPSTAALHVADKYLGKVTMCFGPETLQGIRAVPIERNC